jgi:glycosyltransferase involved in cell wall biosynthesis
MEFYPSVSVILPTYNRGDFIAKSINALVSQNYPKDRFEIVAIDDGSTDNTQEILKAFKQEYPFFKYIAQDNRGPASARNFGIRSSRGEIMAFIDDDCVADEDWIFELTRGYENDAIGGTGGRVDYVPPNNNIANQFASFVGGKGHAFTSDGEIIFFGTGNASFRRGVLLELGGFDETFPHAAHEDVDLSERVKRTGWKLLYHDTAVVRHYHKHDFRSDLKKGYQIGNAEALYQLKHGDDMELFSCVLQCLFSFCRIPLSVAKCLSQGLGLKQSIAFPFMHRLQKLMVTSGKVRGYYSYRNFFDVHGAQVNQ